MITLMMDIGTHCNLACIHCSSSSGPKGTAVDPSAVNRIIQYLQGGLVSGLQITGGEPLMWPRLPEILKVCQAQGIAVVINTNLTLPHPELWLNFSVVRFQVSLDGPDESVHDRIRGKGSFYKTYANLKALVELEVASRINLSYVCMSLNLGSSGAMVDLAAGLGVELNIADIWESGRGAGLQLSAKDFFREIVAAGTRALELRFSGLRASLPERALRIIADVSGYQGFTIYRCHAAATKLYSSPTGEIRPCIKTPWGDKASSSYSKISEAMLSPPFKEFRAGAFGNREHLFAEICRDCSYRATCTPCTYEQARSPAICAAACQETPNGL